MMTQWHNFCITGPLRGFIAQMAQIHAFVPINGVVWMILEFVTVFMHIIFNKHVLYLMEFATDIAEVRE